MMKNILFALVSATGLAMAVPASAQQYDAMPPGGFGGASSGYYRNNDEGRYRSDDWRNPRDWRDHRNDWRDSSPSEWRRSRNDWQDENDWRPRYRPADEDESGRTKGSAKNRPLDDEEDEAQDRRTKDDAYSDDCSATNRWRGPASGAPCR